MPLQGRDRQHGTVTRGAGDGPPSHSNPVMEELGEGEVNETHELYGGRTHLSRGCGQSSSLSSWGRRGVTSTVRRYSGAAPLLVVPALRGDDGVDGVRMFRSRLGGFFSNIVLRTTFL